MVKWCGFSPPKLSRGVLDRRSHAHPGFAKKSIVLTFPSSWYRSRRYVHFDLPLGESQATKYVQDSSKVASHSFYPLISFNITSAGLKRSGTDNSFEKSIKNRRINYSAHLDAHIYSYYGHQLLAAYEARIRSHGLEKCVLAFRRLGKSNIDFALEAFKEIKDMGDCVVFAFDFSKFFDTLNHKYLKSQWANVLGKLCLPPDHYTVFKSLSRYSYIDREKLYECLGFSKTSIKKARLRRFCTPKEFRDTVRPSRLMVKNCANYGIPQGTPISAVLSNIYMLEFDSWAKRKVEESGGVYKRYCDDILFIMPLTTDRILFQQAVDREAKRIHLELNMTKTEVCQFLSAAPIPPDKKPLQYLGFTFDGESILLRSSALARYSQRMKRGVRNAASAANTINTIRSKRGADPRGIFTKQLYARYSHHGRRNFITYALKAAKIMKSESIRRQLRSHWTRLRSEIQKYDHS